MIPAPASPRVAVLGAGRSRNGLGPFLAQQLEHAGAIVVAVVGRDPARAAANAAELAARLGHGVAPVATLGELAAHAPDALVVATPAEHHLAGLAWAAAHGIACLCEKPLVLPPVIDQALRAVTALTARGALLAENCQWPFVLPAVAALHGAAPGPVRSVAMGLSPTGRGPGPMLHDALPHLLSVVQACADAPLALHQCALAPAAGDERCELHLQFTAGERPLAAELQLRHCAQQPRPAWLAVDGRRIDRRLGPDYAIRFAAATREVAVADPMQQLVAAFVADLRRPDPGLRLRAAARIGERLRLYGAILRSLGFAP